MSRHRGVVRSFELGGPGSGGRRWAARCSCGALGTSGSWREALTFLTQHLAITAQLRATWLASHPTPDVRGEYWFPVAQHRRNGHKRVSFLRRMTGAVGSIMRVVVGLQSFATRA
jgi:hypothetical protein